MGTFSYLPRSVAPDDPATLPEGVSTPASRAAAVTARASHPQHKRLSLDELTAKAYRANPFCIACHCRITRREDAILVEARPVTKLAHRGRRCAREALRRLQDARAHQ